MELSRCMSEVAYRVKGRQLSCLQEARGAPGIPVEEEQALEEEQQNR